MYITKKYKYFKKNVSNILRGIFIFFNSSYNNIKTPNANLFFFNHLKSSDSGVYKLFLTNYNSIVDADKIINGKLKVFNLIIDVKDYEKLWHTDFISGIKFPNIPYTIISDNAYKNKGADIIVPWELSRFQFIPTLIQAYILTDDQKYIDFFENIFDNWILENQYKKGVNWKTAMDVGIRSINIGLALIFFESFIEENKKGYYYKIMAAHFDFILNSVIKNKPIKRHNHYLVSIVSLMFLSNFFSSNNNENIPVEFEKIFMAEILRQFNFDGVNFESANHYHQLALETVLFGLYLIKAKIILNKSIKSNLKEYLDQQLIQRIISAVQFVNDYMKTFSRSPQFGDSDDGRIIIFKNYYDWNNLNHYFIIDMCKILLPEFGTNFINFNPLYKETGYGFYFNDNYGICLNNSITKDPVYRGHNHFDKSSFVFQVKNIPIFIDCGTFCYTSDIGKRNQHKKTRAHNVVMIDRLEQAKSSLQGTFSIPENIEAAISYSNHKKYAEFEMSHTGYNSVNNVNLLTRKIKCFESKLLINDLIYGNNLHFIELIFNIAPNICIKMNDQDIIFSHNKIALCSLIIDSTLSYRIENGFYSKGYNDRENINRIILSKLDKLPCEIKTEINLL